MPAALTTVRIHCGGGAGIQTILKTIVLNGVFAMRAFTLLFVQNTTGVSQTHDLSGPLTMISDSAEEAGADSLRRIFLFSIAQDLRESMECPAHKGGK